MALGSSWSSSVCHREVADFATFGDGFQGHRRVEWSETLLGEFRSEEHAMLFARAAIREMALDQHAECWAAGSTTSITIRTTQGYTLLLREAVYADDRRVMQSELHPPLPCGSPFSEVDFSNF